MNLLQKPTQMHLRDDLFTAFDQFMIDPEIQLEKLLSIIGSFNSKYHAYRRIFISNAYW